MGIPFSSKVLIADNDPIAHDATVQALTACKFPDESRAADRRRDSTKSAANFLRGTRH